MDQFSKDLVLTSGASAELPGNLFFGGTPLRLELMVLSGVSNDFSTVKFIQGASSNQGSLLIGGTATSGIFQVLDLSSGTTSGTVEPPKLKSNNITDLTD